MWKAFPSPLVVHEYHNKYQYCMIWKQIVVIAYFSGIFYWINACEKSLMFINDKIYIYIYIRSSP